MEQKVHLKVFLAAPDELAEERDSALALVAEWNREPGTTLGIWLELLQWRTDATPEATERGQAVINRQLLDQSDIVVGIFWTRFGAGTEEEIRRGIAKGKKVLIYFSDRLAPPSRIDPTQIGRVVDFKNEFRDKSLYWDYQLLDQFTADLRRHLTSTVRALRTSVFDTPEPSLLSRLLRVIFGPNGEIPPSENNAASPRPELEEIRSFRARLEDVSRVASPDLHRNALLAEITDLKRRVDVRERKS